MNGIKTQVNVKWINDSSMKSSEIKNKNKKKLDLKTVNYDKFGYRILFIIPLLSIQKGCVKLIAQISQKIMNECIFE